MSKHEAISLTPLAPTAKAVLVHRKKLETARDELRVDAAELALKSARGDTAAQAALWAIPAKQAGIQFEIDSNHAAYELATKQDSDAEAAWRASLQSMAPEDLIAGIGADQCPALCQPGSFCIITASYPYAAGQCAHPIREKHRVFSRDENGDRQFLFAAHSPQSARVFEVARAKLKVPVR